MNKDQALEIFKKEAINWIKRSNNSQIGLVVDSINVIIDKNNISQINISYTYNDCSVYLNCESIPTDMAHAPHVDAIEVLSSAGPIFYWNTESLH